jgi:hypothetical protein
MRVVLTEDDLTSSFNTPFIIEKLQRLQYQGQPLKFSNTQMRITPDKKFNLQSQVRVGDSDQPIMVDFTSLVEVQDRRQIRFVDVSYQGNEEAVSLGQALIDHVNNLLDLDKFALDGTSLRIDRFRIQNQSLVFYGAAQINQFPQMKKR